MTRGGQPRIARGPVHGMWSVSPFCNLVLMTNKPNNTSYLWKNAAVVGSDGRCSLIANVNPGLSLLTKGR